MRILGANAAFDFKNAYWTAAHRLLFGGNPYAWTPAQVQKNLAFVYPALSALVFVPFALFSPGVGSVLLLTFVCMALTPFTLWISNVRDWRIYGITLMWLPVFVCWQTVNETIFLVAMVALVWRYRDHPRAAGILTAVAISLKPFIWPLALWLLATRRWRASIYSVACGVVLNVGAWAVVGFGEIHDYLRSAALDTHYAWNAGYSVAAFAAHLGFAHSAGDVLTILVALVLACSVVYAAFQKRCELHALTLAIALMLVASPVVWNHYFALLLVPMALARPRFSWLWALPVLMWACPQGFQVHGWQEDLTWIIAGTLLFTATRRGNA